MVPRVGAVNMEMLGWIVAVILFGYLISNIKEDINACRSYMLCGMKIDFISGLNLPLCH